MRLCISENEWTTVLCQNLKKIHKYNIKQNQLDFK